MNLKNINNIVFILFISLFLISCQFKNEKSSNNEILYNNKLNEIENDDFILSNIKNSASKNYIDFFTLSRNFNYDNFFKLNKKYSISNSKLKSSDKPVNIFIKDNVIYSLDKKLYLNKYDLNDGKLIGKNQLEKNYIDKLSFPQSMAFYNESIFINFSNGIIINYNLDGQILWKQNLDDINKTPIKFYNKNLIILLSNKIVSLNPINGNILWEYEYIQDNPLSSKGGKITNNKNLLYFVLPNGRIGEIDTLLSQKNNSLFANIKTEKHIINIENKIHTKNNIISLLENDKYITSINIKNDKFLLKKQKIDNFISSIFHSNALFTHDNTNLYVYNLFNKKLFWKSTLNENFSKNSKIVEIISNKQSLIVFFSDGYILELDIKNGTMINDQKLKLKEIYSIDFYNKFIFMTLFNGKTIFYQQ